MIRMTIGGLLAIFAIAPTLAQTPLAETAPPAVAKEKRICKASTDIGTLVPKRTCRTAAEWKDINEANAKAMQQFRRENTPGAQQPQ